MASPVTLLEEPTVRAVTIGKSFLETPFDARDATDLERLGVWLGAGCPFRQAEQIHGDAIDLDGTLGACDAFLVRAGQAALVRHADCFPVVVADPSSGLAVVAHCGWKGVILGLARKSALLLLSMGCSSTDLVAAIGPGIGPSSFEVGPEVLAKFAVEFHRVSSWGTPSVDLTSLLRHQLTESGVSGDKIITHPADTFSDPDFHSFRRERELSGRNATVCIVHKVPSLKEIHS